MKTTIFLFLTILILQVNAKDSARPIQYTPSFRYEPKFSNNNIIKLKMNSFNSKGIGFKYEVKIPMSYGNMVNFYKKSNAMNRFQPSNTQYNTRFQNLSNININAIVEKNKLYNITRNGVTLKTF